jgi:hypothetical protein
MKSKGAKKGMIILGSNQMTRDNLIEIVNKWAEKLNVKPNRIQVRKMKKKWSSCSSKGNLTFSKDVLLLPQELAEYVIVHELLHLLIPNHGKEFKALLSVYLPNWRMLHREISVYSKEI